MARHGNGWIKIYRSLIEGDIGQNGYCLAIFITLLSWANRDKSIARWNGKPREVQRGSLVTGLRELAEKLDFSKDTVHRQLRYLESRDTIKREAATDGSYITIVNYEEYQDVSENLRHAVGHDRDTSRPQADRKPTHNEEDKKKEEENILLAQASQPAFDFEFLFKEYPRRKGDQGKKKALARCVREFSTPAKYDALLLAVRNYRRHCDREKITGTEFVKQFTTFVNSAWEEWVSPPGLPEPKKLKTMDDLLKQEAEYGYSHN